jgi:hypothetical protein
MSSSPVSARTEQRRAVLRDPSDENAEPDDDARGEFAGAML